MRRLLERVPFLAGLAALLAVTGCESFTETVSCGMGTVLDEEDMCVPPPPPDGGVAVETCDELCDLVSEWDAEQVECLQGMIFRFGTPPECMGDLTDPAVCTACIAATGAMDTQCATAASLCQ
jgi:hypothetical protein